MYIVFLRFSHQRAQAGQWMVQHQQWLADGFTAGVFLMAGSLDEAQGGVVIAAGVDPAALQDRVNQDPFVKHGVVKAEIQGFKPSRLAEGLDAVLAASARTAGVR